MIFKLSTILVLIFIVQVQSSNFQQNGSTCGEVIQISDEWEDFSISYKLGERYSTNERCVWTIRVPGATNVKLTLNESGIKSTDPYEGLSISEFRLVTSQLLERTEFMGEGTNNITFLNADVIIITFVSGSDPQGTGFLLTYSSSHVTTSTSRTSRDFIISDSPNGLLSYPESGNYNNNELSTFIFAPPKYNLNDEQTLHTEWRMKGLDGNCLDVVVVFKFYFDIGWSRITAYCQTADAKLASHNDMILMVFKTDYSIVSSGFNVTWYIE